MAVNSYDRGALVKLSASFAVSGTATDPTTVSCSVVDPAGTTTTPTVNHDGVGAYSATVDLTTAAAGLWSYRWAGTGTCQAAEEAQFYVEASAF